MSCSNFECDVGYMSNAETVTNSGFECDVGYMLNAEAATIPGHTSASIFTYEFEDGPIGELLDLACAGISLRVRTLASSPASLGVSTFADELRMDVFAHSLKMPRATKCQTSPGLASPPTEPRCPTTRQPSLRS